MQQTAAAEPRRVHPYDDNPQVVVTYRSVYKPFSRGSRVFVPVGWIFFAAGDQALGHMAMLVAISRSSSSRVAPAPACTAIPWMIA